MFTAEHVREEKESLEKENERARIEESLKCKNGSSVHEKVTLRKYQSTCT